MLGQVLLKMIYLYLLCLATSTYNVLSNLKHYIMWQLWHKLQRLCHDLKGVSRTEQPACHLMYAKGTLYHCWRWLNLRIFFTLAPSFKCYAIFSEEEVGDGNLTFQKDEKLFEIKPLLLSFHHVHVYLILYIFEGRHLFI